MKITGELFASMQSAIAPLDTQERRERYKRGEFHNADRVKDLNRRYRWDLYWTAQESYKTEIIRQMDAGEIHDSHIYTALRNIVSDLV